MPSSFYPYFCYNDRDRRWASILCVAMAIALMIMGARWFPVIAFYLAGLILCWALRFSLQPSHQGEVSRKIMTSLLFLGILCIPAGAVTLHRLDLILASAIGAWIGHVSVIFHIYGRFRTGVFLGWSWLVSYCLRMGADVNVSWDRDRLETPIQTALSRGHRKVAKLLIAAGADIDASLWAFYDLKAVRLALELGADPTNMNALTGNIEIAKYLIESGANIRIRDKDGSTLLHHCYGEELMAYLLDLGLDPGIADNQGRLPMHSTDDVLAGLLHSHGAEIEPTDENGRTPLHIAAVYNHHMVSWLLDHGADPRREDIEGRMPIYFAVHEGNSPSIRTLVSHGGSCGQADIHLARDPIDAAAASAAVDTRDIYERPPLHWAVACGDSAIVDWLLAQGAAASPADCFGWTPLHLAVAHSKVSMAISLISGGADLNAHAKPVLNDMDAQHISELAEIVKEQGCKISGPIHLCGSPLLMAVAEEEGKIAKALLAAGADPDQAWNGWSPRRLASAMHSKVIE